MTAPRADRARAEHVLVLAPQGRDAQLCCDVLERAGIDARPCKDIAALVAGIANEAGAAVVVEETLTNGALVRLAGCLGKQEAWSDFPIVLLAALATSKRRALETYRPLGNVRYVERPTSTTTLVSAVEAALRGRRRQYDAYRTRQRDEVELQHAADFQQRLIGISGHDLRNPLSVITMAASLLSESVLPEAKRISLSRMIAASAERMGRIVEDLGDYSRARVGVQLPLFPRPCDFHRICHDVLAEVRATNPDRVITYDADGYAMGTWDPDRMKQVLSNLLTNAVKYGSAEHPISLRWKRDAELHVEVANRGAPIPPDLLPEIFEPFRLGESPATNEKAKNSLGLGLFITREIVRAHGGDVSVTSTDADGTTFAFRLPPEAAPRRSDAPK